MKKAVFFDIFGVLYPDTFWGLADKYIPDRTPEQQEALHEIVRQADKGLIDQPVFWQLAAEQFAVSVELLEADRKAMGGIDNNLLDLALELRSKGVKTGVISNVGNDFIHRMMTQKKWDEHFDTVVLSSESGFLKPSPEIFMLAMSNVGTEPQNSLFFDDIETNVSAAIATGMNAEVYKGIKSCRESVSSFLEMTNTDK